MTDNDDNVVPLRPADAHQPRISTYDQARAALAKCTTITVASHHFDHRNRDHILHVPTTKEVAESAIAYAERMGRPFSCSVADSEGKTMFIIGVV